MGVVAASEATERWSLQWRHGPGGQGVGCHPIGEKIDEARQEKEKNS